jgi:hypothetical protein
MKTYKAELVVFFEEDGSKFTSDVMDLVNVEDSEDRLFADPDSFTVGELVTEDNIRLEKQMYVDEQTYDVGSFAFKKF